MLTCCVNKPLFTPFGIMVIFAVQISCTLGRSVDDLGKASFIVR